MQYFGRSPDDVVLFVNYSKIKSIFYVLLSVLNLFVR